MPMDFGTALGKKPGIQVWRIETFKPKVYKCDGNSIKLFSGDAFMILHTYKKDRALAWNLHFWLGKDSSQDEQGTAAILTVDMDDQLGGAPVQYREVQGHESSLFMGYFKKGIQYLDGGVDSGFKHVERDKYKPRLFQVKGKRNCRIMQVELSRKSMNDGDCFILDDGLTLYQWNGKEANKYEKFKGMETMGRIKDAERGGKAKQIYLDSGKDDPKSNPEAKNFWKLLGGFGKVKTAAEGGSDDEVGKGDDVSILYRVSDASGKMVIKEEGKGKLKKEMLDTNDVFILDTGAAIFVWIGKGATKEEKKNGMKTGMDFIKKQNRPDWTPISRIVENAETPIFKSYFFCWPVPMIMPDADIHVKEKKADDTSALYRAQEQKKKMIQNTEGDITVWRIEDFNKVEVNPELHGQFYAGDSYIVLFKYLDGTVPKAMIYFWQGRDSSTDEKGSSALLTKQLDDEMDCEAIQIRVVQNAEPDHFLALFQGRMVVHHGGCASGFKNVNDVDSYDTDGISLFHVRGTDEFNTRAVQIEEYAKLLNSGDCFVLTTPNTMYVWYGAGANDTERDTAASIGELLKGKREVVDIEEGDESSEFWDALGGEDEYMHDKQLQDNPVEPRLFNCSNRHGWFKIEEVCNYSQDDLLEDDIMILDVRNEVFVWIGKEARQEEKEAASDAAMKFVSKATDGRDKNTPIYKIHSGKEPTLFTCHFLGWNYQSKGGERKDAKLENEYEKKIKDLKEKTKGRKMVGGAMDSVTDPNMKEPHWVKRRAPTTLSRDKLETVSKVDCGKLDPEENKFPLAKILKKDIPPNVDQTRLEEYLNDEDFKKAFKISRNEYNGKAPWKKKQLKKQAGVF